MGLEAECVARHRGQAGKGRAFLESDDLTFRGAFRFRIPLRTVRSAEASGGVLILRVGDEEASLELGTKAVLWAERIRSPRSRAEKLGLRTGVRVSLVGPFDREFRPEIQAAGGRLVARPPADLTFARASARAELARVGRLAKTLDGRAALWIVYPKGRDVIREADVLAAGRVAGLVDVKVVRFSETETALKFVRPREHQ